MALNQTPNIQLLDVTKTDAAFMTVTPAAATTVRNLLEQREIPDHVLRVFVAGGGCSGMQYGMAFEAGPRSNDTVVEIDGVRLVVDPGSAAYLEGATIDFVDSLMGGGFRIDNPNAVSSCGCGSSFRTNDDAGTEASAAGCDSCASY